MHQGILGRRARSYSEALVGQKCFYDVSNLRDVIHQEDSKHQRLLTGRPHMHIPCRTERQAVSGGLSVVSIVLEHQE